MKRRSGLALSLTLLLALSGVGVAAPAFATPGYPSWDEVAAARDDTATARAESERLNGLLRGLREESEQAQIAAQIAGERYQVALEAQTQAEQHAASLAASLEDARTKADQAVRGLGSILTRLARSGSAGVTSTLLTQDLRGGDLLYELGALEKLSASQTSAVQRATELANRVSALEGQAEIAAAAQTRATQASAAALAAANASATEASAKTASTEAGAATLGAQIAFLTDRSTSLEEQFRAGEAEAEAARVRAREQQRQAELAAAQAAAARPAPTPVRPTVPGPRPVPAPVPVPEPAPVPKPGGGAPVGPSSAAASAVNFARAQVGKWYVFGAAGPDTWDCSGLTMVAYRQAGVNIGAHTVGAQYRQLTAVGRLVPRSQGLVPGDLLFYGPGGSTSSQAMYHITIYIGGGQMIEAPQPGQRVQVTPVRERNLVPYIGRPAG